MISRQHPVTPVASTQDNFPTNNRIAGVLEAAGSEASFQACGRENEIVHTVYTLLQCLDKTFHADRDHKLLKDYPPML